MKISHLFKAILFISFYSMPVSAIAGWKGAEFSSMRVCLEAIKRATQSDLDIVRDTPKIVSGFLSSTRKNFMCTREESGSKGVYYEGAYEE